MKLHYMIEYVLRDRIREPRYEPVGVWGQGPGSGLDLVIEFLPGRKPSGSSTAWWKTTSGLCPMVFWRTTNPRFPLTAACAGRWSKPTSTTRPRPARGPCSVPWQADR